MYAISSALSRKLIGTSTRPQPLTPKNDVKSRAELCDTTATRSPRARPSASRPAAWARARRATSFQVSDPHDGAGWSGSSTIPTRSPYTSSARSRKSFTVSGTRISIPLRRGIVFRYAAGRQGTPVPHGARRLRLGLSARRSPSSRARVELPGGVEGDALDAVGTVRRPRSCSTSPIQPYVGQRCRCRSSVLLSDPPVARNSTFVTPTLSVADRVDASRSPLERSRRSPTAR